MNDQQGMPARQHYGCGRWHCEDSGGDCVVYKGEGGSDAETVRAGDGGARRRNSLEARQIYAFRTDRVEGNRKELVLAMDTGADLPCDQEHRGIGSGLPGLQAIALVKGWRGAWEPATGTAAVEERRCRPDGQRKSYVEGLWLGVRLRW